MRAAAIKSGTSRRMSNAVKGVGAPRATRARGAAPRLDPPASSARLRGRAHPPTAHDLRRMIGRRRGSTTYGASMLSCGTPSPVLYMTPRLYCALTWPCSAARRNQMTASAASCGYSCSPSTIQSTFIWPAPPVFSREARLAILATHGVLGARVPWHPRPSASRRVRPRRCVCQLAPLHGWHSPGRRGRGPLAAPPSD